ncbi:NADH-quinone oxidoreductase subunit C [Aliikangiella marina]|uniref:NADH-quinone oxidoreductase subunit C n=1 Tax=Aliikangiella marina TaxID=1712262 RepID=A0A545TC66_9GAMM|nr:NADH-quinone oxidoreductase subunit C [Aliikangiella marina]TQV74815.1 NADH-quinone oxidoreductase subunit C [Aliikangiella marina]
MSEMLIKSLEGHFKDQIKSLKFYCGEVTIEISPADVIEVFKALRDKDEFQFEQLIDLCGIDYLKYGEDEWETEEATGSGFARGREVEEKARELNSPRFAVVYHLLSVTLNQRLRVRVFVNQEDMQIPSVIDIWNGADWFEREAFDLFGILFEGHPDLRRILTDYGFIGHPFRKDFPVIGELEMRFDEEKQQCVYEPVSIEERILVPRVIRRDVEGPKS